MKKIVIPARKGIVIEFWLKNIEVSGNKTTQLSISDESMVVYKVIDAPGYHDFYYYSHPVDGELTLEINDNSCDVSVIYFYYSESIVSEGVTFIEWDGDEPRLIDKSEMKDWYNKESFRPDIHFSPFKAWMNDPNGLCKLGDTYHMFYQYHPNSTEWGPMHWGHAISQDLLHWTHLPVFNHPEQNLERLGATGGAFSGTTFVDKSGKPSIFFTERRAAYHLEKDYVEVQKKAELDPSGVKATSIREVLTSKPEIVGCDIRDPKVWYDEESKTYRMILGSVYNGDPAVLQYVSSDSEHWKFSNVLYRAPSYFAESKGRCVECPDFFKLGNKWVLIFGIVGYHEVETQRHNLLYALIGNFDNGEFFPDSDELQVLDFATEYYALQTFNDGERQVGIAWLFNWATKKPIKSIYNGEMSIPREMSINNNNRLAMRPIREMDSIVSGSETAILDNNDVLVPHNGKSFEIYLSEGLREGEMISFEGEKGEPIRLVYRDHAIHIETDFDEDAQYRQSVGGVYDVRVIFDAGVLEVFINDGEVCATKRSYMFSCCKAIKVQSEQNKIISINYFNSTW